MSSTISVGPGPRGAIPPGLTRGLIVAEILLLLALSLGRSGVYAIVSFLGDLTSGVPLADQSAVLNNSLAPGRPVLDLVRQVLRIAFALAPVGLVWYFLARSREGLRSIGLDLREPLRDLGRGAVLAALVGGAGLLGYLVAHAAGVNLTVVAQALPDQWWRSHVLIASALENALLEESVVLGFLIRRLTQLGWGNAAAIGTSAMIRGSYHLYQGLGGLAGNIAMGVLAGWLFHRWGRVLPLVIAHALIDVVAFLGYAALAGHVSWLPSPG